MGTKIGAAVSTILALALLGLAMTGPASAITQPRVPSVRWAEELPGPKPVAVAASAPAAAAAEPAAALPAAAQPAVAPKAEPKPAVAEPAVAPKAEPKPALAEPAVAPKAEPKPALAEPAVAPKAEPKPAVAEPAVTPKAEPKPAVAEPAAAKAEPKVAVAKPRPAEPAEPAEPQGMGTLSVVTTPEGVEVFLDGVDIGPAPIDIDVPSGNHRLKFVDASGAEQKQVVKVSMGKVSKVQVSF